MTEVIHASAQTIRNLKDVPASFRLAAFALLNTQSGSISFVLPGDRVLEYRHDKTGPHATIIVHNYDFVKRA
ncbi:MAG TPA: hypothetical protein DD728_14365, partial [Hyphomonas atlantica]|nr:hypothetical protein [Hyphomonas atlantica]